ncbi:hypothetical protein [Streptomyces griseiscabiei]|uniref:DUF222 domain-containing protein n=1 Tax=Streptomyces griseiscabiei TaxID=2993540 RepID=A0ABU4KXR6_9ACTN|nr:hypothetical protein [Streptomyces griseiscabiei]MBZ3904455.1 hypothetical protein [Streptomyces griseiscabiei]MDX2908203.1 hypothetical protein [Streptomyces griseiscabiei]
MSDGISDDAEDVVGVLTEQIERRFEMSMSELTAAVAAAPDANPAATDIVKWHALLTESQAALDRAEDDLLAVLQTQPREVDGPTLDVAHRVNTAVTARDGRALVVRWLLDPDAPGKTGLAAERLARLSRGSRPGPAVPTSAPASRPAAAPATGRGVLR